MPTLQAGLTITLMVVIFWLLLTACLYQEKICEPVDPYTTSCTPSNDGSAFIGVPLTQPEAIQKGFPLYYPSSQMVEFFDLDILPKLTMKYGDRGCSYLDMDYYQKGNEDDWLFGVSLSNGCRIPVRGQSIDTVKLSWARWGTVEIISRNPSGFSFSEPRNTFLYQVWSSEPISTTLELLESMEYVEE